MTTPVASDQLRINVEKGDDYTPTPRVRTALNELVAALAEAEADEVEGFMGNFEIQDFRAMTYDSSSPKLNRGNVHGKVELRDVGNIFKF